MNVNTFTMVWIIESTDMVGIDNIVKSDTTSNFFTSVLLSCI
jgi:hypothetical protein